MEAAPRRVIDAHTHAFPPAIVDAAPTSARATRGSTTSTPTLPCGWPRRRTCSPAWTPPASQRSLLCGFPWRDPGLCREHTACLAEVRAALQRPSFLGIVVPHAPDAARDAQRAFELGAVGLGEFNADAQDFDLRAPAGLAEVLELCTAAGHADHAARQRAGWAQLSRQRLRHAGQAGRFLTAFPAQPVVLAHWGGGLPFYELMPEVRAVTRSLTYDSAATTYLYNSAVFPTVVGLVGPERVLFASDFPVLRQDRLLRVERACCPSVAGRARQNAARVYHSLATTRRGRRMIAGIRGTIADRDEAVIVDLHGLLLRVATSHARRRHGRLANLSNWHLVVREDSLTLYGFPDLANWTCFCCCWA